MNWLRRMLMRETYHEVKQNGNLYYLFNAFIGALNKIGDALMRMTGPSNAEQLNRIEKKLDQIIAAQTDPEALKQLAAKIKSTTDTLESAVKKQTTTNRKETK